MYQGTVDTIRIRDNAFRVSEWPAPVFPTYTKYYIKYQYSIENSARYLYDLNLVNYNQFTQNLIAQHTMLTDSKNINQGRSTMSLVHLG